MSRWRSMALMAMAAFGAGCSSSTDNGPVPNSVNVTNNAFTPATMSIDVGESVTWIWNSGGATHNVTFAAVAGAPSNISDAASGSFPRTFNQAGTFNYQCGIHGAAMSGSVTVTP